MKHLRSCLSLLPLLLIPSLVHAESDVRDLEGTAFAPNNTVVALGYFHHESSTSDLHQIDQAVFRGLYLLKFGDFTMVPIDVAFAVVDYTAYAPVAAINPMLTGGPFSLAIRGSGIADLTYLPSFTYTFHQTGVNHTVLQFNPRVTIPIGAYDDKRPINIGNHRWTITPYIGIGQRFASKFTAEAYGSLAIHTDNTDVLVAPSATTAAFKTTKKQDPDLGLDVHLGYDMSRTFFLGASYYLLKNGSETTAGVSAAQPTTQSLRFNFGIRIEKGTLLLLQFNQDVATSHEGHIARWFGARISHVFFDEPEPSTPTVATTPRPASEPEPAHARMREQEPEAPAVAPEPEAAAPQTE